MRSTGHVAVVLISGFAATAGSFLAFGQAPTVKEQITTSTVRRAGENVPKFDSEPGWTWLMKPQELKIGRKWGRAGADGMMFTGFPIVDADGGALRIFFARAGPGPIALDTPSYRLVVIDKAGGRHVPKSSDSGGSSARNIHLTTVIFTIGPDQLKPEQAAFIGVEQIARQAP